MRNSGGHLSTVRSRYLDYDMMLYNLEDRMEFLYKECRGINLALNIRKDLRNYRLYKLAKEWLWRPNGRLVQKMIETDIGVKRSREDDLQ